MPETYLDLGPPERQRLAALRAHALTHRIDRETVDRMAAGVTPPVGDDAASVVNLRGGYRVVYSVEQQPSGWCHHLSISVARRGRYPLPQGVEMLMRALGITRPLTRCRTWIEAAVQAVNVVAPVEEDPDAQP